MRFALAAPLLLAFTSLAVADEPTIAPSEARSPADEKATFKLPPGFEAQLVASEPDIGKPIQIAFDAKGRLWVTTSRLYPFPAAAGAKPTDKLYVLSDFGPDGKAKKVVTFADDLNIPIGVLPLPDCNSCLVSNVGSIVKLTDTDGDGKADKREVILTGFGSRDTHGMMNSFVLLPDGWVYACHGYSNSSVVKAKDGSEVRMQSGNTFRFRPDGSRVEPWTFGQVNPFGMTVDPWLNLYTADCHSKPITQLIRGAHYDSFGKPHDGLGYAPHVTRHDHGSTALCGLAWYEADHFPKEWTGCMFLGNVVTNRVNADKIVWKGSTPEAKELPDFLVSGDPWFRPTDLKLGPDGALYVADFYNRIIGHYEVPLTHPQRDKDRGRVWRIVYMGVDGKAKPPVLPYKDLTTAQEADVIQTVGADNLAVRLAAVQELQRRNFQRPSGQSKGNDSVGGPRSNADYLLLTTPQSWNNADDLPALPLMGRYAVFQYKMQARLATNDPALIPPRPATEPRPIPMVPPFSGTTPAKDLHVRRASVEAMITRPSCENVVRLVTLIEDCPADDTHLMYAARIALRNTLRDAPGAWDIASSLTKDTAIIADVAVAVPTKEAAAYLLGRVKAGEVEPRFCERIGRSGDDAQAAATLTELAHGAAAKSVGRSILCVQDLIRGLQSRGATVSTRDRPLVEDLCGRGLRDPDGRAVQAAVELVGGLKLTDLFDPLAAFARQPRLPDPQRSAALASLLALDGGKAVTLLVAAIADPTAPAAFRDRAAQTLGAANQPAARTALVASLQTAPAKLAATIAAALAGSPAGADALLDAMAAGKASPRLLQDKAVAVKVLAVDGGRLKPRVDGLTKGLPSADARLDALIRNRSGAFTKAKPDVAKGKEVFVKQCAVCHQLGGQGAKVGPQLDGIGVRGVDRLLEDVLDPNRNVDLMFRATVVSTADGRTLTGLQLREEGQVTVLADATGKEVRIEAKDVDKKTTTTLSPMPANFDTAIPEADFHALMAYLLTQRAK